MCSINVCKYKSWHCMFVYVIKCNKRKKYPNYPRILSLETAAWKLYAYTQAWLKESQVGASVFHQCTWRDHAVRELHCLSRWRRGKGEKSGGVCCKQWGCFMNANLTGLRLERHQHVNTPDREGCTAIISKQPRPSQSTQAFYKC